MIDSDCVKFDRSVKIKTRYSNKLINIFGLIDNVILNEGGLK